MASKPKDLVEAIDDMLLIVDDMKDQAQVVDRIAVDAGYPNAMKVHHVLTHFYRHLTTLQNELGAARKEAIPRAVLKRLGADVK
jgi:hypothetical protein